MYKFTEKAERAIKLAQDIAKDFKHNYIGTEHILLGLIREETGVAYKVLILQGESIAFAKIPPRFYIFSRPSWSY